ncbi:ATP-binding protein [Candidatus Woesearchaeota archaeon]|nr:ATP-binding protein [Candidatus Woesearchaeota archaeon]
MTQQKFINRKEELAFLERAYASKKSEMIILYGRRRIGKTELLIKFLEKKSGFYFLASTESDQQNINNFKTKLSEFINDASIAEINFKDWFSLFDTASKNINFINAAKKNKIIICIDEFPYLISTNPAITSLFQKAYDLILKNNNCMLILTGSSIMMMEENVLGEKSPLYGRRTGQWLLKPLSFAHIKDFFDYKIEESINVWSVLGGIPEYLLHFDNSASFWGNVKDKILSKGEYLYDEAEVLMRTEFREPRNYMIIFKAIAFGKTTLGEICSFTGMDKSMVSKYIDVLKTLHLIKEEIPITASPKFKRRLYSLSDHYFTFWFRYVYSNKIDLEAYRKDEIVAKIKRNFSEYSGFMFEKLIEELIREKILLKNYSFTKIGKWWHEEKEIDIVAFNEETNQLLLGECKWQEKVDAYKIISLLNEKADSVAWHNSDRKEIYAVFAKSFSRKIDFFKGNKVVCIDLLDIEKSIKK